MTTMSAKADPAAHGKPGAPEISRGLRLSDRAEAGRQMRLAVTATLALAAVISAYVYGVPVLASRLVHLVPPAWEASLGDTVAQQMETSLGGLEICDPDPESLANRALRRFGEAAIAGTGTPFDLDIQVVRSEVPNAIALPGGKVYFFSNLLHLARTPDEFAGVLAHEIGHVVNRHGMEQLISTAGTGALIGFILGPLVERSSRSSFTRRSIASRESTGTPAISMRGASGTGGSTGGSSGSSTVVVVPARTISKR